MRVRERLMVRAIVTVMVVHSDIDGDSADHIHFKLLVNRVSAAAIIT